jgi:hypothetical protein
MDLLDRYVKEVGKHLPRKNRADIENELRSTLQDMLEDRSQKTERPVDEPMVMEVLKEYGAPKKVAGTYLPEHYLIGPKLYPLFILVVRIVFTVLTVLALIGVGVSLGKGLQAGETVAPAVGNTLLDYLQGLMAALGNIALIFVILERVLPAGEVDLDERDWDPAELQKASDEEDTPLWEPVFAILILFAGLVVLNFYPQALALYANPFTGRAVSTPLLSAAFFTYLPWINLIILLDILLNVVLLRLGRWTKWLRAGSIVTNLLGVALAVMLLRGPSLVGPTPQALAAIFQMEQSAAALLLRVINQVVIGILVIVIIGNAADIVKTLYRLIVRPNEITPLRLP